MIAKPNKSFCPLIPPFLLMAVVTIFFYQSCSREASKDPQKTNHQPVVEPSIDTALWLKFTTGVLAIFEDSKGNVWFGSHQEGVCKFDGEKLTYFTQADGLSSNQVKSIFEDQQGKIWFVGGTGVSWYDGEEITLFTEKSYSFKENWALEEDDLWFKGNELISYNQQEGKPGVYRYDGTTMKYHVFPLEPSKYGPNHYSGSTPFIRDQKGTVWFGTYGAVIGYNGNSFKVIDDKSLGLNKTTGFLHVRSLFEDSKGNLWIGNNGIGVFLHQGDSTLHFSEIHGLISFGSQRTGGFRSPPGSLEHVFSIGEDSEGNIWFGDKDTGAWKYNGQSFTNYTQRDGLSTNHIWQIYLSKNGELWFAMADGSVLRFNGQSFDRKF